MDIVTKIVTLIGSVAVVVGLFWSFTGFIDYMQARKNKDRNKQDEGLEAVVYGGVLAAVAGSIATAIVNALSGISF